MSYLEKPPKPFALSKLALCAVLTLPALPVADQLPSDLEIVSVRPEWSPPPAPLLAETCSDADGDGFSPDGGACGPIDCDDSDPLIYPGAREICDGFDNDCDGQLEERLLDADGEEYCLDIVHGPAIVGAEIAVTVYAYHERGVYRINLVPQDSVLTTAPRKNCDLEQYCRFDTIIPAHMYPGMILSYALLYKQQQSATVFAGQVWEPATVKCPAEYCPPEPLYLDFVNWMREKGYYESIISHFAELRFNRGALTTFRRYLQKRPSGITQPFTLTFHDIIPTDTEATFAGMGPGEAPACQGGEKYTNWCNPKVSADYTFVERHFEQTFGIDFEFNYLRSEFDYTDSIGEPTLVAGGVQYRFPFTYTYRNSFPRNDIVHHAMTSWLGTPVESYTTAAGAAFVQSHASEPNRMVVFTHEWGHTMGLAHTFYDSAGVRVKWGLLGVGENSYNFDDPPLLDQTTPLDRYALEPDDGYRDEGLYAQSFGDYIIGTSEMKNCGVVDPEILDVAIVATSSTLTTFQLTLTNLGSVPVSFVPAAALDLNDGGAEIEERIIDRIAPGELQQFKFTLNGAYNLENVAFVLDPDDLIAAVPDHPESACPNPIQCADLNNDGSVANIGDVVFLIQYIFAGGGTPAPLAIADMNGLSDGVNIADVIHLLNFIFSGGPAPSCPF
ncbi:MAG TPA: MopE-related protein [candidate division Zixibacteria bacterium]|nr:MopE-related protein [candidate division Zixibacteria bacterium]